MEIEDAIDEAEDNDLPDAWTKQQAVIAAIKDVEAASLMLEQDLKYPITVSGSVLMLQYMPDVAPTLVYHLIRAGWRRVEDKRLIKQRRIVGPGQIEDLVTYVPMDSDDEPIHVGAPEPQEPWSVTPVLTDVFEERS